MRTLVVSLSLTLSLVAINGCSDSTGTAPPSLIGTLTLDQLKRACVITGGCGIQVRTRVGACIESYANLQRSLGLGPTYDKIYTCVLAATNCAGVEACFGPGETCDIDYKASCDKATAVTCDLIDNKVNRLECAPSAQKCGVDSQQMFASRCGCDASYAPRCAGDWRLRCESGDVDTRNCAELGFICSAGDCVAPTTGDDCDKNKFSKSCDGNTLVQCEGGKVSRYDCTQNLLRKRCDTNACVVAGTDCVDQPNMCSGNDLQACINGTWEVISCSSLGLGPCAPAQIGANCSKP